MKRAIDKYPLHIAPYTLKLNTTKPHGGVIDTHNPGVEIACSRHGIGTFSMLLIPGDGIHLLPVDSPTNVQQCEYLMFIFLLT